jgi:hypothetical protein
MIVCIAEDRGSYEAPLQLLILSLAEHSPNLPVYLFYPVASIAFTRWLDRQPQVTLSTERFRGTGGWSIKPQALLRLLDLGYDDVLWIDSDIIVTKDITGLFAGLDRKTICATEESLWGQRRDKENELWRCHGNSGALRVALWNLKPGRSLLHVLNTAVLRVTFTHRPLLTRWNQMLQSPGYRDAQEMPFLSRPLHIAGDQDVLTALLASSEFSHVQIFTFKRGCQIIQFMGLHGYTLSDRFWSIIFGIPAFIHAQAQKPWIAFRHEERHVSCAASVRAIYADVSPYTLSAIRYRQQLEDGTQWMDAHFLLSRILRIAGFWYPPLVGLPVACMIGFFVAAKDFTRWLWTKRHRAGI